MKKIFVNFRTILSILLIAILCAWQAQARSIMVVTGGTPAAGDSCSSTPFVDTYGGTFYDYWSIGSTDNRRYLGNYYASDANRSLCRVDFEMNLQGGDLDGKTIYVEIWEVASSSSSLPTDPVANGTATVSCSGNSCDSWSSTSVTWNFSPTVSLVSGTNYKITVSQHATDATNYPSVNSRSVASNANLHMVRHGVDKSYDIDDSDVQIRMRLYATE